MSRDEKLTENRLNGITQSEDRQKIPVSLSTEKTDIDFSDKKLRAVFNTITDGIAVTDLNGIMTNVNMAVVKMNGAKSEDELIGKSAFTFIAPADLPKARENLQLCLKEGSHCAIEYTFLRADGTSFPAELTASVLRDSSGNPFGFAAVTRDISERKRAELKEKQYIEDLVSLSQAAKALVEQLDGVHIFQLIAEQLQQLIKDNTFILVGSFDETSNSFTLRAFLGPEEKLKAMAAIMSQTPSDAPVSLPDAAVKILRTGKLQIIPGNVSPVSSSVISDSQIKKVEELFSIAKSYAMGINWHGKLYGYVVILVPAGNDLRNPEIIETFVEQAAIALQRKDAQDALAKTKDELEIRVSERTAELTESNASLKIEVGIRKQIEEELRRSETFNVSLLENAPNPILVNDADGTIRFVNKAFKELTGFSGKQVSGLKPPYPWWPRRKVKQYSQFLVKDTAPGIHHFQRLLQKSNGEPFWVEITATNLTDERGDILTRILLWQDITERKNAEKKLLEYQKELQSLASELILVEENERRNIATLIHGGVTQLLALSAMKMEVLVDSVTDPSVSATLNEIYKIIQQAIEDTRTLTFELSPPALYDLGLGAALEELAQRFGEQYGIDSTYEDDEKPKPLEERSSVLLFQIVREILHNIQKHPLAHRVVIRTRRVNGNIHLTVKDDGPGLNLKSLGEGQKGLQDFDIFSIRERLSRINGQLRFSSRPGHGNRFTIIAPLKDN